MTEDKTTITDNEVIARFMSYFNWEDSTYGNYDKDWNRLMPVWYKFKYLIMYPPIETHRAYMIHYNKIQNAILHKGPSPSEACKLLAEGIRWYNSTQNKEQS